MGEKDIMDQEEIYSKVLRAGRRTYFFDVRSTKAGDYYLTITESKKFTHDDGSFHYKKHKVYLYKEDFTAFKEIMEEMMEYIIDEKGQEVISERHQKDFKKEEDEESRLLVGSGIKLNGEITNCAELVVEGQVDARVEATRFAVSSSGQFSGECNVEEADIAGQFDGTLNCRGKLVVRSTGKLKGTLRYGDVEIEGGGRIAGEIQEFGSADQARSEAEPAKPQLKAAGE